MTLALAAEKRVALRLAVRSIFLSLSAANSSLAYDVWVAFH